MAQASQFYISWYHRQRDLAIVGGCFIPGAIPISEFQVAVGMGTGSQFRIMGSAVTLAIAITVFRSYSPAFTRFGIDPSNQAELAQRIMSLTESSREELRVSLGLGYNRQSLVTAVFAAAQIPITLLVWKKEQVLIA